LQETPYKYPISAVVKSALSSLGYPIGEVNGKEENEGFWENNVLGRRSSKSRQMYSSINSDVAKKFIFLLSFRLNLKLLFGAHIPPNLSKSLHEGRREGTFKNFVHPVQDGGKSRIDVVTFARASKVILSDDSSVARGVRVERFGQEINYFASECRLVRLCLFHG
jgi:hypothetical protein